MADRLAQERLAHQKRIATALAEEEDPLAAYHEYVQWIIHNYPNDKANSGLIPVLEEATRKFKDDVAYKTDLRYLKIWMLYAKNIEKGTPASVYGYLLKKEIGTAYAILYEEFASVLEQDGRFSDADTIYRKGIKRQVRPLEKLKTRYREFQARRPSSSTSSSTSTKLPSQSTNNAPTQPISAPPSSSPYAHMLAPPAPGKRPEKLRFSLPLLFSDGVEYSNHEARARSMGLLGKKWGPPHPSELQRSISSQSSASTSSLSDDGDAPVEKSSAKHYGSRRSLGLGLSVPEPTVTINTKEALADVFGMYNSPDKTMTTKIFRPGSKYAPVKRVEMGSTAKEEPKSDFVPNTPAAGFRPFVDENNLRKENATPAPKLKPYVDPDVSKTPFTDQPIKPSYTTPRPALALKDHTTPSPTERNQNSENALSTGIKMTKLASVREDAEEAFGRVFTPAATTRTHQGTQQERTPAPAFKPFVDDETRTPFKVFSRPPEQDRENAQKRENVFSAAKPFTPFSDKPTFTPFKDRDVKPAFTPFRDKAVDGGASQFTAFPQVAEEEEPEEVVSESTTEDEYEEVVQEEQPIPSSSSGTTSSSEMYDDQYDEGEVEYAQGEYYEEEEYVPGGSYQQEAPLGGRFGPFNVMTPITERTFEFTSTRSVFGGTPSDQRGPSSGRHGEEYDAVEVAERLAAELRVDEDDRNMLGSLLAAENARGRAQQDADEAMASIEEKTGKLSLLDTLTKTSHFKPPNPCNAFDPPIMTTLLSLVTSDSQFHDFNNHKSNLLDGLQKFSKKARKTSGSSNHGGQLDVGACFPVILGERRFEVSEKLGEGGFGAVFKAKERRAGDDDNDDDDLDLSEDEDEDGSSMVALKIVKPRNLWEYHALRRVHSTLPGSLRRSVVCPQALYAFRDESFLVLELCKQGSLLNVVNSAVSAGVSQQGGYLDELLVMFFAIELIRLIEGMHRAGFIHGDLKIDNCLLRLEDVPGGASAWASVYQPSGEGGWASKGIKLIDFGRTIDTKLFPSGQQFIAEWPADERDCPEIREDRMWTYQSDYYGLAGIIYCMLFGKYMQSSVVGPESDQAAVNGGERYKVLTPFKRYWQTELWNRLFDILLNPCLVRPDGQLPVCDEIAEVRRDMEAWLQKNCNRTSNTLKGLLKKVELSVLRAST